MLRHRRPTFDTQLAALFACPLIHDLAAAIPPQCAGRPARHPVALHLAWAALARWHCSGNRLDAELAHGDLWERIVAAYNTGAAAHPDGVAVRDGIDRLYADTHRHTRDRICDTDILKALCDQLTESSVALAQQIGLLQPTQVGSRTRPNGVCTIYGDGTILRPMYSAEAKRNDPDVLVHHRHDGAVAGTKLVHFAVRGPEAHRRIMLALGHVADQGREADRSIELVRDICRHAPDSVAAVVYDGAFRGVHHNLLMTELGLLVINKPHGTRSKKPRTLPLGTWTHDTPSGPCQHALASVGGSVCDASLDDAGRAVVSEPCDRVQVRRYQRPGDRWRFSVGFRIPCAAGAFTAWISPHPGPGDTTAGRADQLRLIPPHEKLFDELYGLRNDSEAINANYKRTHLYDRAPVLGWRRQLFDLLVWSILNNTLAWWHHAPDAAESRTAA